MVLISIIAFLASAGLFMLSAKFKHNAFTIILSLAGVAGIFACGAWVSIEIIKILP